MILRRDIVNTRILAGPTSTTVDNDVMSPLRHNRQRRHLSSLLLFLTLAVYLSVTLLDNEDLEATTTAFTASASHPSRSLFIIPNESTMPDILPSNEQLATLSQTTRDSLPTLSPPPKKTYSLRNVLATQSMYKSQFGIVVYSPTEDIFTLYYSNKRKWKSGCHKLIKSFIGLSSSLRELFPDKFHDEGKDEQPQRQRQNELALALSAGDSPDVYFTKPCHQDSPCISSSSGERHADANAKEANPPSPVLQFGSAFQNAGGVPTEIPMPMPQSNQLGCFVEWSHGQARGVEESVELCRYYLPRSYGNPHGLVYHAADIGAGGTTNDPDDMEWENLIPQVIWRGTDFSYLGKMRKLRSPDIDADLLATTSNDVEDGASDPSRGIRAMKRIYGELVPRWKGVVLTAEAEWEVRRAASSEGDDPDGSNPLRPTLPWANMKFSHFMQEGRKTPTDQGQTYHRFQSNGIPAIGEYMPLETLAKYKYHIDLGGGGGTTWSGTLEKLALPGLLFHHVTPTKDYFHDALVAWVHYVPINEDLSDLKQKYEWAEAHPVEAKRIARRGTEWVKRWYGTKEGFGQVFDVFYRERLRGVLDAYRHEDDWREVLEREGGDMRPIMRCTGFYGRECEELDGSLDYHVDRSV